MLCIGLISKNRNSEFIKSLNRKNVEAVNIKKEEDLFKKNIDILVLEDLIFSPEYIKNMVNNNLKYLIIQDNINNIQLNLDKEINLITFGFNHKSTVTISSVTNEHIVICIQRTIKGISGKLIYPEEQIIKNTNKYNINKYIIKKIIQEILDK